MKNIILTLVFLSSLLLGTSNAMAVKLAPFPNSSPLQPLPLDVIPNLSGSVNTNDGRNALVPIQSQANLDIQDATETSTAVPVKNNDLAYLLIILVIFISLILYLRRKFK